MWQAKGTEENVHNVVGVNTWNPRTCLVVCIVRHVSCWQCLISARRILHSTKCHPMSYAQVHQVMGTSFSVFWILLMSSETYLSVQGYVIAFSCFRVCQQPVWLGIMLHKSLANCLCIWLKFCLVCSVYLKDYWTVVFQAWVEGNNSLRNGGIIPTDTVDAMNEFLKPDFLQKCVCEVIWRTVV